MMYTILFADDEPVSTGPLRMLLEAQGFRCLCVSDMSDAMRSLNREKVDVLVSDIMMPGGPDYPEVDSAETGFVFVKKVRSEFRHVAIICLSVIGDQAKINELKKMGVLYLRKGETPLDTAARLIESKATGLIRDRGHSA